MKGNYQTYIFKLTTSIAGLLLAILIIESGFRLAGFKPQQQYPLNLQIEPDTSLFVKDSLLGFRMQGGHFKLIYPDNFQWEMTNDDHGFRINRVEDHIPYELSFRSCWILGCSYTYGWSVNDDETFSYLLQKEYPDWMIHNMGQPAYSTIQSLLLLQNELLKNTPPDLLILAYAAFHDERNLGTSGWIDQLAPYNELGRLTIPVYDNLRSGLSGIHYKDVAQDKDPLSVFSSAYYFLKTRLNAKQNRAKARDATKTIINEMAKLCKLNDIEFKVVILNSDRTTADLYKHLMDNRIETFDFTIDTRVKENINHPHDSHPNAKSHYQTSRNMLEFFD